MTDPAAPDATELETVTAAFQEAADGCSLRQAAYRVAVARAARAVRLRGYV